MTTLFATTALLPDGWADNVLIEYDRDGWIVGVDTGKDPATLAPDAESVDAPLLPGMPNVHSHTFQYLLAGLTERARGRKRTFWNWRDTMYRVLSTLTPEDVETVSAYVYIQMLKAGYTSVCEFHYLHHQPDGRPYDDRAALSHQIIRAALESGIALTHLPVLYAYGGFGEAPPAEGQKRFLNTVPALMHIVESLQTAYAGVPQVTLGLGHHSLRAVSPEMLREGTAAFRALSPKGPIHIHAAEQREEVDGCLDWSGQRPVAWLLDHAHADTNWTFLHCTHVDESERAALARARITVGLCPTTEANLGDGIFPLLPFFEEGGIFGIGSDSHVTLNAMQELRWLEYVQRLIHGERALLATPEITSVGAALYERAATGGAQSTGRPCGRIDIGHRADFITLDPDLPLMAGKLRDHILDTAVFASNESPVRDVMSGGRWVVKNRHHKREAQFAEKFKAVLRRVTEN